MVGVLYIRVYRLEIQSVMLVFRPSFVNCCLLTFCLIQLSPPPSLPYVNKYTVYTYSVCSGGGYGVLGLRQINICREVPLLVNFLDDNILHCLLWVLSFFGTQYLFMFLFLSQSYPERSFVQFCGARTSRSDAAPQILHKVNFLPLPVLGIQ